jgi:hypothetical protein
MGKIVTLEVGAYPKWRRSGTRTVGDRVIEAEYLALEQNPWKAGKTLTD